jgi:SAM-dependent methyltransferase
LVQHIANTSQAESWDGADGDHWTEHEDIYNGAVAAHHKRFMEAGAIGPSDRVLDIGCGTGQSTCDAARLACSGSALGVDLSSRMIERAREHAREQALMNVRFEQADAQVHPFEESAFDVALSRFGAMFFDDPVGAFRNIGRALCHGGRLVLLSWQRFEENTWIRSIRDAFAAGRDLPPEESGRPGPFGLAEADHINHVLTEAGFAGVVLQPLREKMWFGNTVEDAFNFWTSTGLDSGLLGNADDVLRSRAYASLRDLFSAHETSQGIELESAAWLTTARMP